MGLDLQTELAIQADDALKVAEAIRTTIERCAQACRDVAARWNRYITQVPHAVGRRDAALECAEAIERLKE